MARRDRHLATNGRALGVMRPTPSLMSTISSPSLSHSKHWISDPNTKLTTLIAKPSPAHPLLPNPNGKNMNPSLGLSGPKKLSGLSFVGSAHSIGSFWMAQTLTSSIVPDGTRKPPTVHCSDDSWAGISGAAGHIRRVSFTMALR